MADSKKNNGSTWEHSLRKLSTATDTITTLPADLYPNDTTATVGLKGNMSQTGTPTPDNPVMPQGCGDLETVGTKAGQYKIPISSNSTTTNVYLGEVQTTRRIKKLVLTGESNINKNTPSNPDDYLYYLSGVPHEKTDCICSHLISTNSFPIAAIGGVYSKYSSGIIYISMSRGVMKAQPSGNTVEGFKEYLAAQYAAGTPVTVWYVLASETTGIVNEPLRKIGDYADEVSNISIPVTAGGDTISVGTTLQPSEVTVNYKGWHPVADVHERENGAWT